MPRKKPGPDSALTGSNLALSLALSNRALLALPVAMADADTVVDGD